MRTTNGWIEIGHGVRIKTYVRGDASLPCGVIVEHSHQDGGKPCRSSVLFDVPANGDLAGPKWQIVRRDPLSLSPSIRVRSGPDMTECLHGHVRDGAWVPA